MSYYFQKIKRYIWLLISCMLNVLKSFTQISQRSSSINGQFRAHFSYNLLATLNLFISKVLHCRSKVLVPCWFFLVTQSFGFHLGQGSFSFKFEFKTDWLMIDSFLPQWYLIELTNKTLRKVLCFRRIS